MLYLAIQENFRYIAENVEEINNRFFKKFLDEEFSAISENVKLAPVLFEKFDDTQPFPEKCLDLIEDRLKKYSKK